MDLLLDTHVFLWWDGGDRRLSGKARKEIVDIGNKVFVSAASVWEIAIKRQLGKLAFAGEIRAAITRNDFEPLPVAVEDAEDAGGLPMHHSDPFDRLLVAQAARLGLVLVTSDGSLRPYRIPTLEA
jgi:PIN domain nuclease of toxin-antitoxin system